jgi:uncharacterized protein YciI
MQDQQELDMLFIGIAYFKENSQSRHDMLKSAFTEHLSQPMNPRIKLAGAILDDAGVQSGIFMLLESDSIETARAYLKASPYEMSGLYKSADIKSIQLEVGHL